MPNVCAQNDCADRENATATWILKGRGAPWLSLAMGVTLMGWIVAQLAMIGSVGWLQPASFAAGIAVTGLAIVALRGLRTQAPVVTA